MAILTCEISQRSQAINSKECWSHQPSLLPSYSMLDVLFLFSSFSLSMISMLWNLEVCCTTPSILGGL